MTTSSESSGDRASWVTVLGVVVVAEVAVLWLATTLGLWRRRSAAAAAVRAATRSARRPAVKGARDLATALTAMIRSRLSFRH